MCAWADSTHTSRPPDDRTDTSAPRHDDRSAAAYAGDVLLHLVLAAEWSRISSAQMYEPPSLTIEGFVHCTGDDETMFAVANRFYAGVDDEFVVLGLDPAALTVR